MRRTTVVLVIEMRRPRPLRWLRTKMEDGFWYRLKEASQFYLSRDWTENYMLVTGLFLIAGGWFWPFAVVVVIMMMYFIYLIVASANDHTPITLENLGIWAA